MCATFNVISFSTIDVYIITGITFTLNMIHVLKFVSFSYIMYFVLRHVGGSRDSGTGCALDLVGVSRYNFTNVYFCIGAFTVTSFDVSRGRLESLVGKRFVVVWLRVYFAGIQSLFAFISLIHKIMI